MNLWSDAYDEGYDAGYEDGIEEAKEQFMQTQLLIFHTGGSA
jgi:flagellar biosynthesis/type III secretory pathway protein FliH